MMICPTAAVKGCSSLYECLYEVDSSPEGNQEKLEQKPQAGCGSHERDSDGVIQPVVNAGLDGVG